MISIAGKTAIVTGAAEGLGREIARELAASGMKLALLDNQQEKLDDIASELTNGGAEVLPIVVDLSDARATKAAGERALEHFGTAQTLIHNAALLRQKSMLEVSFEDWRREVDIILQAAFILSKVVWPVMTQAHTGSILYLSSGSARSGFTTETAYTPGKHGQEGLMKVLSLEGREYNVAVNTVNPGRPMDTPMSDSHYTPEMRVGIVSPSVLAPAFAFLAGIDADFATGQQFSAYQVSEAMTNARERVPVEPKRTA